MKLGIDVDITLKTETSYINIPVIPSEITYDDGSATPVTVSVLQLGDVDFYNGVALDTLSWSCFFPARYDAGYCRYSNLKTPTEYRNIISGWKGGNATNVIDEAAKIQVIIPSAGINKTMVVASFKWVFKGFEGDLYYDITLKEYKEIKPIQVSAKKIIVESKRKAAPVTAEIKKGDKVKFKGGGVSKSSNQAQPNVIRKTALCNCTATYNGKHPYHLIHYNGDIVYGWVDAADCEKL